MLETVAPLEAFMIGEYLKSLPDFELPPPSGASGEIPCVFLRDEVCTIYPARPIICRTHGLPLIYPNQQEMEVCQLNFTDVDITTIEPQYLLNAESITENLMRLNLAFCILTGEPDRAGERIPLDRVPVL
jgi:Fe-S-cluster containining protein